MPCLCCPVYRQTCIVLYMNTSSDLKKAARDLRTARARLQYAMETARLAALDALNDGVSEVQVSKALDVNRMTVRKWAGK